MAFITLAPPPTRFSTATNSPVLTATTGLPLTVGATFGLTGDAIWTGDIYGISSSGSQSVAVTEGT